MQSLIPKLASSLGGCLTVYGTVYICFRIAEKLSKPQLKQELARAIKTSSSFTIGTSLPKLFMSMFDAVFTDNLWSLRGFFRSTLASIVTVIILIIFWSSSVPDDWHIRISVLGQADHPGVRTWFLIASRSAQGMEMGRHGEIIGATPNASLTFSWLPLYMLVFGPFIYNLFADFVALIVTRKVIDHLSRRSNLSIERIVISFFLSVSGFLMLPFIGLYLYLVMVGPAILHLLIPTVFAANPYTRFFNETAFVTAIFFPFYRAYSTLLGEWSIETFYGVFVWSTLMGLIWLAIFSVSALIANLSMRLRGVGPWLEERFRVETRPFHILEVLAIIPIVIFCAIYHIFG